MSHPMWVRGLKLTTLGRVTLSTAVAPHVGAWIETLYIPITYQPKQVAPHVGAWIETWQYLTLVDDFEVAPHVGAWIET